jgi:predicted NACHT family NTPase
LRRITDADDDSAAFLITADIAVGTRRLLVVGPPGSGKSTLSQAVARRAALDRNAPVPFLVQLRHFVSETLPGFSVVEYIEHQAKVKYQVAPPPGVVEHLLGHGQAIVVFDGLDEMVGPSQISDTAAIVALFARGFPLSTIVITTRETAAHQKPLATEGFEKYLLEELSDSDIAQYAQQWFGADDSVPVDRRNELANDFLAQSSSLPDLRRNPLLLSLSSAKSGRQLRDERRTLVLALGLYTWHRSWPPPGNGAPGTSLPCRSYS